MQVNAGMNTTAQNAQDTPAAHFINLKGERTTRPHILYKLSFKLAQLARRIASEQL